MKKLGQLPMPKKRTKLDRLVSAMKRGWVSPMKAYELCRSMSFNQRANEMLRDGHPVLKRQCPKDKRVTEFRLAA